MSSSVRLAVLGGSGASTPELMDAIADWPGGPDRRPALDVVLQGRSRRQAGRSWRTPVGAACQPRPMTSTVRTETSLDRALEGADVVLIQVRVGGLDARIFDETFPRAFGLPGEETMGPGGFADALRTVPAMADTWDRLAERAADAFIINLTNPSGIVTQAATAHAGPALRVRLRRPGDLRGGHRARDRPRRCRRPSRVRGPEPLWLLGGRRRRDARRGASGHQRRGRGGRRGAGRPAHPLRALLPAPGPAARIAAGLRREPCPGPQADGGPDARPVRRRRGSWSSRRGVAPSGTASPSCRSSTPSSTAVATRSSWDCPTTGAVPWAPDDAIVELPTDIAAGGGLTRRPAVELPAPVADLLRSSTPRSRRLTAHAPGRLSLAREPARSAGRPSWRRWPPTRWSPTEALAARLVDHILASSPA